MEKLLKPRNPSLIGKTIYCVVRFLKITLSSIDQMFLQMGQVDDGVVKNLNLEEGGEYTGISGADAILNQLGASD